MPAKTRVEYHSKGGNPRDRKKIGGHIGKTTPDTLSDKEELFIHEYLVDLNIGAAAKRIGILKNPTTVGGRMLKLPRVQKALTKLMKVREEKVDIIAKDVLQELAYSVFRDPLDLCDPKTGQLIVNDMRQIPKKMRACIEGIEVEAFTDAETGNVRQKMKLKLTSKMAAMELAMKHLGLIEPVSQNVKVTVDWDRLYQDGAGVTQSTPIEDRINAVKNLVDNTNVIDSVCEKVTTA